MTDSSTPPPHQWDGHGPLYLLLRVLDHQIEGPRGELLGNVDDLELATDEGAPGRLVVRGLLSGAPALAGRQPGRAGDWLAAIWRRLHLEADPRALVVSIEHVTAFSSAVVVDAGAAAALESSAALEQWLRRYVVSRLPGAAATVESQDSPPADEPPPAHTWKLANGAHLAGQLLRARVVDAAGHPLGDVLDVAVERVGTRDLVVAALVFGRHHVGANLGYTVDARLGPQLVGSLVRAWHRGDLWVRWSDVGGVTWDGDSPVVTLRAQAAMTHPHRRTGPDAPAPTLGE